MKALDLDQAREIQLASGVIQGCETTRPYAFGAGYVQELRDAGIVALNLTLATPQSTRGMSPEGWSFHNVIESIDEWDTLGRGLPKPGVLMPVRTGTDLEEAKRSGRIAIIFGLQGAGYWLDRRLRLLRTVHRLGVRIVGVSYMRRDIFAEGSGEPGDTRLSSLGEHWIREMNHLGMVIDLSHTGRRAALEAMALSKDPVIFSHSNAHRLCANPRNLSDEQIDALAQNGGVIGIATLSPLVRSEPDCPPTVEDLVAHIDYIVQRVGPKHVGLGWEYAHGRRQEDLDLPNRLYPDILGGKLRPTTVHCLRADGPEDIINVTVLLLARGYTAQDVTKILYGNWHRVFSTVWH